MVVSVIYIDSNQVVAGTNREDQVVNNEEHSELDVYIKPKVTYLIKNIEDPKLKLVVTTEEVTIIVQDDIDAVIVDEPEVANDVKVSTNLVKLGVVNPNNGVMN